MNDQQLRETVARSCRLLARLDLAREITGHVSLRVPGSDEMYLRCRAGDDDGVAYTRSSAIRRVTFDGAFAEPDEGHRVPLEYPAHAEVFRAMPEVSAVVHVHPHAVLLCSMAGVPLRPVYGAYDHDPFAVLQAAQGIPVFPRAVLIKTPALGRAVVDTMNGRPLCVLRGHGIVMTGRSVEEATLRAIKLEQLAAVCWELAKRGDVPAIASEDLAEFAPSGSAPLAADGDVWTWRHYVRRFDSDQDH